MLAEELAVLASAGASALVTAMVTDGWEGAKARFARLLGRGSSRETANAADLLEQSRVSLFQRSGVNLEQARSKEESVWRARLIELIGGHPEIEAELRSLVHEIQADLKITGQVAQSAIARDQAQQAVQGYGVQTNIFGSQAKP